jgi:hypothetical protein
MRRLKSVVFGGFTSLIIWCFRFVEICNFQGVMSTSTLVSAGYMCSPCDCSQNVNAWKRFYAGCFILKVAGTWILLPCWRSIYSPFLNPNFSLQMFTLHNFCNMVSRSYTGSFSCDEWIFVMIDYAGPLGLFYHYVFPFRLYLGHI